MHQKIFDRNFVEKILQIPKTLKICQRQKNISDGFFEFLTEFSLKIFDENFPPEIPSEIFDKNFSVRKSVRNVENKY